MGGAAGDIALMNVLLPSLVKRRAPDRAGLLIGLYLLSLAVGSIVAAALAVPVFNAAGGGLGAARLILGLWAGPALVAVFLWGPQLRFRTRPEHGARTGAFALRRSALAWQVTLFMGLQSLSYYGALSWFATMFRDRGASAAYAGTLLALMNVGNAITAMAVPVQAHRNADHRGLAVAAMLVTAIGLGEGWAFGPYGLARLNPWWCLGARSGREPGTSASTTRWPGRPKILGTAASLSAFAQGIGYLIASLGPLVIGLLHTATGGWTVPLNVLLAGGQRARSSPRMAGRAAPRPCLPGRNSAG